MRKRCVLMFAFVLFVGSVDVVARSDSVRRRRGHYSGLRECCAQGTKLERPVKRDKVYPVVGPVSSRRGLGTVTTTVFNVHTREAVPILQGSMPPADVVKDLFRCRGFGKRAEMDPRLVSALLAAAESFSSERVEIISAFRSPKFNDILAKKGRNVASESFHTRGEAIDFTLPGISAGALGQWLWESFEGGVGIYQIDGFVHIDVGPKRRWFGR